MTSQILPFRLGLWAAVSGPALRRRRDSRRRWDAGTGFAQLREFVLPELQLSALANRVASQLESAQLDAADLARDRLRQLGELDAPNAFVRGEALADEAEDLQRHLAARFRVAAQH